MTKMKKEKKPKTVEEVNGVHGKEKYPFDIRKPVHERYGEHIKMNESNAIDSGDVIDCSKRGKAQDVTNKEFEVKEPKLEEDE